MAQQVEPAETAEMATFGRAMPQGAEVVVRAEALAEEYFCARLR
jgi:hypothetical protein